ncbi:MAG TPA: DUF547 domain-containing protein [Eudoraea sp.]|nr:DUF547 domain-containing protein [Eudoraea sp.]
MSVVNALPFLVVCFLSFSTNAGKSILSSEYVQTLDHSAWNTLLKKYVDTAGNVDYKSLKNDKNKLDEYLGYLAGNVPSGSDEKEKLAYYINLYNAATVKLILDHYPVKSIKDINAPWDKKWVHLGEKLVSLGDIEHKILRRMNEPRIHFAINCASYSCPKLLNEAFTSSQLELQLQKAARDFVGDPSRNKIASDRLQLSNIFKWYIKDFTENSALVVYIDQLSDTAIAADAKIDYLKYDWSLNEIR